MSPFDAYVRSYHLLFGFQDFSESGHRWVTAFCRMDSDGDGRTNGQELGDPECVWTPGATPQMNATGHPGIKYNNKKKRHSIEDVFIG